MDKRGPAILALASALALAGCQTAPPTSAVVTAKASAPAKYEETGTRVRTDHPQVSPDIWVMSQGALQDAIGDHTGPGYRQDPALIPW